MRSSPSTGRLKKLVDEAELDKAMLKS